MKIDIVRIGNSRGVRLPKAVLEQCGFGDEADLRVEGGVVVLAPVTHPRAGWAEAFAAGPDDGELDSDWLNADLGDGEEWEWPRASKSGSSRSTRRKAPK